MHAEPNLAIPKLKPDQLVRNIARVASKLRKSAKDLYLVNCSAHVVKTYNDEYDAFRDIHFVDLCVDDMDCGKKSVYLNTGTTTEPLGRRTRQRPEPGKLLTAQFYGDFPEVECMEWLRGLQ